MIVNDGKVPQYYVKNSHSAIVQPWEFAIVFGLPLMLLATLAPVQPILTLIIVTLFFAVMNVILFRSRIFKRRRS